MKTHLRLELTVEEAADIVRYTQNDKADTVEVVITQGPKQPIPYSTEYPAPIQVLRLVIDRQHIIAAIKEMRDATGWGLKEAKDYVEYLKYEVLKHPRDTY